MLGSLIGLWTPSFIFTTFPFLGSMGTEKIGLRLWKSGGTAFFLELLLFVGSAVIFVGPSLLVVLIIGVAFQIINANSFFGFSQRNPFGSSGLYAGVALVGFAALTTIYSLVL